MSPRGATLLPVKACTVVAGTVAERDTPSTRSVNSAAVSAFSMLGQEMAVPRSMLSHTSVATPSAR